MDTSVDNSNNATNNAFDLFGVFQKRAPSLLECADDFQQNGTSEKKESDMYFMERPTNGKRSADEFDEEEEDDFGPETDVDAIDDVLLSPSISKAKALAEGFGNNNPEDLDEKMEVSEADLELQKQQTSEFDNLQEQREETPTPPVDFVLDSSGIADNVAESGEDSEDEWNYYRVDPKQKEGTPPVETVVKVSEQEQTDLDSEEMSQLNPDAAEFIPVSPMRNIASPTYTRAILDDTLLAQSPRRAEPMDINIPSANEFETEVKQRPSEVYEDFDTRPENQNGHQMSTGDLMRNFLNGKDINEIEYHPSNFVKSVDDVHQENNIISDNKSSEDFNVSGIMETASSPIEASKSQNSQNQDEIDFTACSFNPNKESDPMSMSFYQDKDEEGTEFSTNPFDLNKVQLLPDDIETMPDTKLDDTLSESAVQELADFSKTSNNETKDNLEVEETEKIQDEVCEVAKSPALEIQTPSVEMSSPAGPLSPKSPIPELTELVSPDITSSVKEENVVLEDLSKSPMDAASTATPVDNMKSPEFESEVVVHHENPAFEEKVETLKEHAENNVVSFEPDFLINSSETMSELIEQSGNIIDETDRDAISKVEENVSEISQEIISEVAEETISKVNDFEDDIAHKIDDDITQKVEDFEQECQDLVKEQADRLENIVKEVEKDTANFIGDKMSTFDSVLDSHKNEFETCIESVEEQNLIDTVVDYDNRISSIINNAQNNLIEKYSNLLEDISSAGKDVVEQVFEIQEEVTEGGDHIKQVTEVINLFSNEDDLSEIPNEDEIEKAGKEIESMIEKEDTHDIVEKDEIEDIVENKNIDENMIEVINSNTLDTDTDTKHVLDDIFSHFSNVKSNIVDSFQEMKDQVSTVVEEVTSGVERAVEQVAEEIFEHKSPISQEAEELVESEPVSTEVNEFLDRSAVPELTSPLSPSEEIQQVIEQPQLWQCKFPLKLHEESIDIKHETISPEYPVPAVASPSEENKEIVDTPPGTPDVELSTEMELKSPEPQQMVEAVEKLSEEEIRISPTQEDVILEKEIPAVDIGVPVLEVKFPVVDIDVPVLEKEEIEIKDKEIPILLVEKDLLVSETVTPIVEDIVSLVEKEGNEVPVPEPQISTVEELSSVEKEVPAVSTEAVVVAAAAVAGAATIAVAATTATKTPKPKTTGTISAKKPLSSKTTPTSPTKPLPSKLNTSAKKTPSATSSAVKSTSATTKSTLAPTRTTKTPTPSPRTTPAAKTTTSATKTTTRPVKLAATPSARPSTEKKPLTNGDIKPLAKKPASTLTAKAPAPKTSLTANRTTSTSKSPSTTASARPATAPAKTTTTRTILSSTPKPKVTSTTGKTTATTLTKTSTAPKPATTNSLKSTTTTTTTTRRPATAPPKPKTTSTITKITAKAPDTEKQIKETANKQLSAARTSAGTKTAPKTSTTTLKKIEPKVSSAKTTTTRTTTTTIKSSTVGSKKPTEVSRTTITKTKNVSAKVPPKQNGVVNVIQEITTVTSVVADEPQLIKDISPIESTPLIDNSQLPESVVIAD